MFRNYILIAFRNFFRNKILTLIHIAGLSIGISASLIIYLLVQYDFSFDKFHKDRERIYRVVSKFNFAGETHYNPGVTQPLGDILKEEATGLDEVVSFNLPGYDIKVYIPGQTSGPESVFKNQKNVVFVNKDYFNLFTYTWLAGAPASSLLQPYEVVLSKSQAALYFPTLKPAEILGKELIFNDTVRVTVTGIVKDFRKNSDFSFKTFISKATLENTSLKPGYWGKWDNTLASSQLLLKLSEGTLKPQLEKQFREIYLKYANPGPQEREFTPYLLQPLSDMHFNHNYRIFGNRIADKGTLYGLMALAAFLLILGCINFVNLSTAHASQRAKEIGIRKTMGSSRQQLIFQSLSEIAIITLLAVIISVATVPLLLKIFADFIPVGFHYSLIDQPDLIFFLLLLVIVVTLLSGFYPALILSRYKPSLVLKNQTIQHNGNTRTVWIRKVLTVSQFVIAQVLIMGTILVSKQISYSLNKRTGFRKDAIIHFKTNYFSTNRENKEFLLNKLKAIPEVAMVSLSNNPPSSNGYWVSTQIYRDGSKEIETDVHMKFGDTNYIRLFQLNLLAGKNLKQSDTVSEFIINETYAHILGFQQPEQVIGKYVEGDDNKMIPITGVVADFHELSIHEPIKPLAIGSQTDVELNFNVLLQPQNEDRTVWKDGIAKIEKAFKEVYPKDDFSYSFFDEDIARYYEQEQHTSQLLIWATGLAIFISCLGMFGLVIFTTTQRIKEIGVRKVLGASVSQIVTLITKDFLQLVMIAFIIASPIAWWAMNSWLEDFAYRTKVSIWIFIAGGLFMMIIAALTLSVQTIRSAMASPVKSLRTE